MPGIRDELATVSGWIGERTDQQRDKEDTGGNPRRSERTTGAMGRAYGGPPEGESARSERPADGAGRDGRVAGGTRPALRRATAPVHNPSASCRGPRRSDASTVIAD